MTTSFSVVLMTPFRLAYSCRNERFVALRLELLRQLGAARGDDPAVHEDVHVVGGDVVEDPLVVRDHERAHLRADELVDALRDDLERVDVEAGVGLVEDRDPRLQHRHLQDLDALLLAAREAVVEVALRELARHLQVLHRREQLGAELLHGDRVVLAAVRRLALRVDRAAQEARDRDARDRVRVLEREEEALLGALVGPQLGHVLAVEQDLALRDLVGRVAHQRVGERRLARAVRAHDRVLLVRVDRQVDALDDLGAVLERDVQVLDLQQCH